MLFYFINKLSNKKVKTLKKNNDKNLLLFRLEIE